MRILSHLRELSESLGDWRRYPSIVAGRHPLKQGLKHEYTRPKYSFFSVESDPPVATVTVVSNGIGTSRGDWVTPCTVKVLVGTSAVISVEKSGYHTTERNVYAYYEGKVSQEMFMLQTDNPVDNLGRRIFG